MAEFICDIGGFVGGGGYAAPRRAVVSSFELQRRREKGDTSAADELRRSLLIDDILSLKKAVEALLLVCLVPSAIMAFGQFVGAGERFACAWLWSVGA